MNSDEEVVLETDDVVDEPEEVEDEEVEIEEQENRETEMTNEDKNNEQYIEDDTENLDFNDCFDINIIFVLYISGQLCKIT